MTNRGFILFLCAGALSSVLVAIGVSRASTYNEAASPVVKVIVDGHGSGVHIGNDYYITAAHVVEDATEVQFVTDKSEDIYTADVLWSNKAYDVALLKARSTGITRAMPLRCSEPVIGEAVTLAGNPLDVDFFISKGVISTKINSFGHWPMIVVVAGASAAGMSGGPVSDKSGKLLGIVVAGPGRVSPFAAIVPSKAICTLLGRVS